MHKVKNSDYFGKLAKDAFSCFCESRTQLFRYSRHMLAIHTTLENLQKTEKKGRERAKNQRVRRRRRREIQKKTSSFLFALEFRPQREEKKKKRNPKETTSSFLFALEFRPAHCFLPPLDLCLCNHDSFLCSILIDLSIEV